MGALSKVVRVFDTYPFSRGLLSYTIIFPSSCLIQQTLAGNTWETYDWKRVFRFWIYGTFFLAPVGYGYVKIMSKWLPNSDLRSNIKRVIVDQTTYSPLMTGAFFGGMSLLEGKDLKGAKEEIEKKFLPTYKTGLCYWPIVQTVNFTYISEKNRVPFISLCGMVWTVFLAFMLQKNVKKLDVE
ncbi:mpv17-like protein isoform X7 [Coccinella septempunctata]|uniref:mpv17-like protein isoform X7 n=1 Tax=Coccinella septempunctata TaxID=41139 RepID=UPI001D05D490|nr:mpv17-like protein isoform X7 [Coccinella septempunctata]XP_044753344.1 mpv17-like protein isoform X7 [Coccinella septempunctata]XP_044753345.1 mpv17-like protein isoform X7 [Coccinella septempunctata]